jgi:diguanylate cyclase (GGDEF)-like protein
VVATSVDRTRGAENLRDEEPERIERGAAKKPRWRVGVRFVLSLVILVPMLLTGYLAASRLKSDWAFRQQARLVANDAAQLQAVASARAQLSSLSAPISAVSYAAGLGISTTVLDSFLLPTVPYAEQLAQATASIEVFPDFSSPILREDVAELKALSVKVVANSIAYAEVGPFFARMSLDIDNLWYRTYDELQADVSEWGSPGSFGVHASTLVQTYQAFLSGARLLEGSGVVLGGAGDAASRQKLIEAAGAYDVATSQFTGHLSPLAQAAWDAMQAKPANQQFAATIQQALTIALSGLPSPFVGDLAGAGVALAPGIGYVSDLSKLVVAASQDLQDSALTQAAKATRQFAEELTVVLVLVVVVLAGVVVAAQVLTQPLRRLADTAEQVHDGDFDLERLPESGPREIAATTRAFNDMALTLKAVEARAVALASEDFSHPELAIPLPGRTGHALQATLDSLAAKIREREQQRQLMHEAATHDQLTGLLNRAAVIDYLTTDVARRRHAGETVAVLFLDLDGLKQLNDNYGHELGDAAVAATAKAILDSTDICDVVGRLGGDEFLVVLCDNHSRDGDAVAERVNENLARHSLASGDYVAPLRASVGVAIAHCDADTDPMTLIRQADTAMYRAKRMARATRDDLAADLL